MRTCSIAFGNPQFDESKYAALVAQRFKTAHNVERVDGNDLDLIDDACRTLRRTLRRQLRAPDVSGVRACAAHVTVALSGDGGDENFGGYRRYRGTPTRSACGPGCRLGCGGRFSVRSVRSIQSSTGRRGFCVRSRRSGARSRQPRGLFPQVSRFCRRPSAPTFSRRFVAQLTAMRPSTCSKARRATLRRRPARAGSIPRLQDLLAGRYPHQGRPREHGAQPRGARAVLDHELVDWAGGVPSSLKLLGGEGKYFFKKALESRLPNDVLYRAQDGFCGAARAVVPHRPQRARARAVVERRVPCRRRVRPRFRCVDARSARTRRARFQRVVMGAADVCRIPTRCAWGHAG